MKKKFVSVLFIVGMILLHLVSSAGADKKADEEIHIRWPQVILITCDNTTEPPTAVDVGGGYVQMYCQP